MPRAAPSAPWGPDRIDGDHLRGLGRPVLPGWRGIPESSAARHDQPSSAASKADGHADIELSAASATTPSAAKMTAGSSWAMSWDESWASTTTKTAEALASSCAPASTNSQFSRFCSLSPATSTTTGHPQPHTGGRGLAGSHVQAAPSLLPTLGVDGAVLVGQRRIDQHQAGQRRGIGGIGLPCSQERHKTAVGPSGEDERTALPAAASPATTSRALSTGESGPSGRSGLRPIPARSIMHIRSDRSWASSGNTPTRSRQMPRRAPRAARRSARRDPAWPRRR